MTSWLNRIKGPSGIPQQTPPRPKPKKRTSSDPSDPNTPIRRYNINQKCLYERTFPGDAFVSAHVNRLQRGYYDSKAVHDPPVENVYFVAIHFVFHPNNNRQHRFKSANIIISVHSIDPWGSVRKGYYGQRPSGPRILKHAPELLYGAVSPESLQWNFSLSSSLGVTHAPVAATVNPSVGVKSNYKIFDMMSAQGSLRTMPSSLGPDYDMPDAMAVWMLEENLLQKSGLPREFDFVLLVHRPDDVKSMYLTVDMDADVQGWLGTYPQWYTNTSKHKPTQDYNLDFNREFGQKFLPAHPSRGFNFADLPYHLEEYVQMPGSTYPTDDPKGMSRLGDTVVPKLRTSDADQNASATPNTPRQLTSPETPKQLTRPTTASGPPSQGQPLNSQSWFPPTLNVRVTLEHSNTRSPSLRRPSGSPLNGQNPTRQHSVRRQRSRSGLKEYSAQQALKTTHPNEKMAWV